MRARQIPDGAPSAETADRANLAAALEALAEGVSVVHGQMWAASTATRALIDEHAFWPENVLWTDGSQVQTAARRIAALLREPPTSEATTPRRRRRRTARGT